MKRWMLAVSLVAQPLAAETVVDVATRTAFSGAVLSSRGDVITARSTGSSRAIWRWASVTKQVVATLVTVRQLLRHQTGLPNPDDTMVGADAVPAYYRADYADSRDALRGYCAGPVKGAAGTAWSYNNCDYVVAGALLQAVTGQNWAQLVRDRIARPLRLRSVAAYPTRRRTMSGTVAGKPEPAYDIAAFGAAAGLYGTIDDLWRFDRALMTGKLLPAAQRAAMWDGQAQLGFVALGQWAFTVPIKGCAKPVLIVERRGAIGGVEVRNLIMPDQDAVVIAFSDRADFAFGEIWQGKGFAHDAVAAAACTP